MDLNGVDNPALEIDDVFTSKVNGQVPDSKRSAADVLPPLIDSTKTANGRRLWTSPEDSEANGQTHRNGHRLARATISSPAVVPVVMDKRSTAATNNSANNNNSERMTVEDFDDVLPYVGEFGTYQIILFFLTAPFCFFLAFSYFSQVFITLVPDHWCHVPELNITGWTPQQKYVTYSSDEP